MQAISVYLYPNKLDVFTNSLDSDWPTARFRKVYNRNLKVFRGVDNRVDLQVLNSSERKKDVTGQTLVFILVARDGNDVILKKDCTIVDATKGQLYVVLTETDLNDIESGFYNFSVVSEKRTALPDGNYSVDSKLPLFIDSQYGAICTMEVAGDVYGEVAPSVLVDKFEYYNPGTTGYTGLKYYISSLIDTKYIDTTNSMHTFQYYFTNFTGDVTIQGSISNDSAPTDSKFWVDLDTTTYTNATSDYKNITGKYNWFRIKYSPALNSTGKLDKALFR